MDWTALNVACCSPWGRKELDRTERLNWTAVNYTHVISLKARIENHLLKKVYLFIYFWLHWVFAAAHGLPLAAMRGLLGVVASRVAECELQELRLTGSRASAGSAVAVCGLICSSACGIFPDQGSNPGLLHWQVDFFFFFFLPQSHQGSLRNHSVSREL